MTRNHSWTFYLVLLHLIIIPLVPFKTYIGPIPLSAEIFLIPLITVVAAYEFITRKIELNEAKSRWFAILFAVHFLAMIISLTQAVAIMPGLMEMARYLSYAILFLIIFKVKFTKGEYKAFGFTFATVITIMGVYGLFQFAMDYNLNKAGLYALTEAWGRVPSTMINPNYYGGFVNMLIPGLLLLAVVYFKNRWTQILFFTLFGIFVLNQILTFTRSAWVIMAMAIIMASFMIPKTFYKKLFKPHMLIASAILIAAVFSMPDVQNRSVSAVFVIQSFLPFEIISTDAPKAGEEPSEEEPEEGQSLKENQDRTNRAVVSRTVLWQTGWYMYRDNPVLGLGIGNYNENYKEFVTKYPELNVGHDLYSVHNSYLKVASETGTLGIVSFLAIYLYFYIYLGKQFFRNRGNQLKQVLLIGLFIGSGTYLGQNMANNLIFIPQLNIMFWLISALILSYATTREPKS
ncbi:O-antigen ligase family protein [Halobacillus litoralis]|uniref:O-antigen ligase family protein n=1 Tax=Halobacillus litoralis TaxID=45668 RepID=UPI001CD56EC7|nr:O-antigen ligase family protein [Halobacillus litoralis]MCA0970983.1 O-antigen ligase family protein [Halobacillus litoralis]